MGNTNAEKNLIRVYIAVEAAILVAIKITQAMHVGRIINGCMYSAIVVNTLVCAYFFAKYSRTISNKRGNLIACALFVTLIADWFLTFVGKRYSAEAYVYGLIAFCTVEVIYALYIRPTVSTVIGRVLLFAAGAFGLIKAGLAGSEAVLGLLNMVLILFNVIDAWTVRRHDLGLLFRLGLLLFLLCDTSIMIRTLTSGAVKEAAHFMTWIFYVPAQVMLVLSYVEACTDAKTKNY